MKIELIGIDEIGKQPVEPKEVAEGVYLTDDGTIFILRDNDTVKITR